MQRVAGATIVVVDDEPSIARLISITLSDAGFNVRRAADGTSALRTIDEAQPALVVLDLQLPDIDGREVYRRMRASGVEVPVVIISAFGARQAQRELGADAAVEKPFDPQAVLLRVESLLDRR